MSVSRCAAVLLVSIFWMAADAPAAGPVPHKITFKNNCTQTIWVGQDGTIRDGWEMAPKATVVKSVPFGFSGRWWPRTGCRFDASGKCPTQGVDCCDSGGCITSDPTYFGLKCNGGGRPPVSLFEPTFDAHSGRGPIDYLDLSLVDGFSVPMQMAPTRGRTIPARTPGWRQASGARPKDG